MEASVKNCRYPLDAGFKLTDADLSHRPYLFWSDLFISHEAVHQLRDYQRINHFPGMVEISRKDLLIKNFSKIQKCLPVEYDFLPRSWIMPFEKPQFKAFISDKRSSSEAFILKPASGACGNGIRVFENAEKVLHFIAEKETNSINHVLQVYIPRPLLIEGMKCDLRIYVLVTSCDPLRVFIYNDGILRISSENYLHPSEPNSGSIFRHLTNYSMNKKHQSYSKCSAEDEGNKRSFAFLESYVRHKGGDTTKIWSDIKNLIVKTIFIAQPHICHAYNSCRNRMGFRKAAKFARLQADFDSPFNNSKAKKMLLNSVAFEILGFDILLDEFLTPWLIEVNRSPSFNASEEFDLRLKGDLLQDTLRLLNIKKSDKAVVKAMKKRKIISRLLNPSISKTSTKQDSQKPDPTMEGKKKAIETKFVNKHALLQTIQNLNALEWFENKKCGGWRRIFPAADRHTQSQYVDILSKSFNIFHGEKSKDHVASLQELYDNPMEDRILSELEELINEAKDVFDKDVVNLMQKVLEQTKFETNEDSQSEAASESPTNTISSDEDATFQSAHPIRHRAPSLPLPMGDQAVPGNLMKKPETGFSPASTVKEDSPKQSSLPLIHLSPSVRTGDRKFAWFDLDFYHTIVQGFNSSLEKSIRENAQKIKTIFRQTAYMATLRTFWLSCLTEEKRQTFVRMLLQQYEEQLFHETRAEFIRREIANYVPESPCERAVTCFREEAMKGVRIIRLMRRMSQRILSNRGQGLWTSLGRNKSESISSLLGPSADNLTDIELVCLKNVLRNLLDQILMLHKKVTKPENASAKPSAPSTLPTDRNYIAKGRNIDNRPRFSLWQTS